MLMTECSKLPVVIRIWDKCGGVKQTIISANQCLSAVGFSIISGCHTELIQVPK